MKHRYEYRLVDTNTHELNYVYLCGICAGEKPWLRNIEPICTVQDFFLFVQRHVTRFDEALRRLRVGIYSEEGNQRKAYTPSNVINTMEDSARVQKAMRAAETAVAAAGYNNSSTTTTVVADASGTKTSKASDKGSKKEQNLSVRQRLALKMKKL